MWWKCVDGKCVNMTHMATLSVEQEVGGKKWLLFACEVAEQSKYLVKEFNSRSEAEKLQGDIVRAEK